MKKIISGAAALAFMLLLCAADVKTLLVMSAIAFPLVGISLYLNRKNIF